jgi:hypothetical protein
MVRENGYPISVSTGGVRGHSGGDTNLYVCNTCQSEVVWATSARTGRRYLCNVRRSYNDGRFFQGNDLHNCNEVITERDRVTDHLRNADITEARARVEVARLGIELAAQRVARYNEWLADGSLDADEHAAMVADETAFGAECEADLPAAEQRLADLLTRYGMA